MIKCKDCGGSISSSAYRCPKCGAVTDHWCRTAKDQDEGATWIMGIFGALFALAMIYHFLFEK